MVPCGGHVTLARGGAWDQVVTGVLRYGGGCGCAQKKVGDTGNLMHTVAAKEHDRATYGSKMRLSTVTAFRGSSGEVSMRTR